MYGDPSCDYRHQRVRVCVRNRRTFARFQMFMQMSAKSLLVNIGSEFGSCWYQRFALSCILFLVRWSVTCQSSVPSSLSSIHQQWCSIYVWLCKFTMQIVAKLPCTPPQSKELASLCTECNIILSWAWGPWFVQTPCFLSQSLWAFSAASTDTLIASPQCATSPGYAECYDSFLWP